MIRELSSRRSIRLKDFDYSCPNWYYVTICTHKRECIFGSIVGARRGSPAMKLNSYGKIIQKIWQSIPQHHNIILDTHQIMPNHMHGIIIINHTGEPRLAPTLGAIIGYFKSECTKEIRRTIHDPIFTLWQRNYYEHIIRDNQELTHIRQYISDNPKNWEDNQ